jgi:hypothetical protein
VLPTTRRMRAGLAVLLVICQGDVKKVFQLSLLPCTSLQHGVDFAPPVFASADSGYVAMLRVPYLPCQSTTAALQQNDFARSPQQCSSCSITALIDTCCVAACRMF